MSILSGVNIIEIEGIGPGPFCGMLLADLGADVVTLCRPGGGATGDGNITRRGKKIIEADLKNPDDHAHCLALIAQADALIEGMRPGVMERLKLGPDVCHGKNPRLIYGRLTGWGQDGPLAHTAGHDINYIGLSGALWYAGRPGSPPFTPPTLIGDVAGGALYLAIGLLAGILKARESGKGDIVDAAMVDGSAHMMNLLLMATASGFMKEQRGQSMLDGSYFYDTYECADGKHITVGALEPQFHAILLEKLSLQNDPDITEQYNSTNWPEQKTKLAALFAMKSQSHWCDLLEGTDACFAPALSPSEAADHAHMKARHIYNRDTGFLQAAPAPRFADHPATLPETGKQSTFDDALTAWRSGVPPETNVRKS